MMQIITPLQLLTNKTNASLENLRRAELKILLPEVISRLIGPKTQDVSAVALHDTSLQSDTTLLLKERWVMFYTL